MKIVLVGSPEDRATFRRRLAGSTFEVVGEFETMTSARRSGLDVDGFLMPRGQDRFDSLEEALTPREVEVLGLLAEGLSNKSVAGRLGISDQTVKFHVASINGKLGATNRTDAVRRAIRRGLVTV